jgi:hypothetical protein
MSFHFTRRQQMDRVLNDARRAATGSQQGISIDTFRAEPSFSMDVSNPILHLDNSIFGQLSRETTRKGCDFRLSEPFKVSIVGDQACDAGGPRRTLTSKAVAELMYQPTAMEPVHPHLKLFLYNENHLRQAIVPNIEWYLTVPEKQRDIREMFAFLGKLIGWSALHRDPVLPLDLPRLVWKFLTFEEATLEDYCFDCCSAAVARGLMNSEMYLDDEQFYGMFPPLARVDVGGRTTSEAARSSRSKSTDDFASMRRSSSCIPRQRSSTHELGAGSTLYSVRRQQARAYLVHRFDDLLLPMREGLAKVIPEAMLRTLRCDDLEAVVCGEKSLSFDSLMSQMDLSSISDELKERFKRIVGHLDSTERGMLLNFASGQHRLPLKRKISVGTVGERFFRAGTCGCNLYIPQNPLNQENDPDKDVVLLRVLRTSIANGLHFGYG